jgi:hypothetical protein
VQGDQTTFPAEEPSNYTSSSGGENMAH